MAGDAPGIHTPAQIAELYTSDSGSALNEFLTLMEDSESPRTYLIWSLIAASAALLGQNATFHNGVHQKVKPNLFVLLLGPSALRKSSAINMMTSMLEDTSLNFGPTDTGGQRHGLMSALTGLYRSDNGGYFKSSGPLNHAMLRPRAASDMFIVSPEFGRLMGSGTRDMSDFLVDLYDGAPIDYQTKAGETLIQNPRATILAATTPSSLANMLPENAVTHGILARFICVYADTIHKAVPLPPEPKAEWYDLREQLRKRIHWLDNNRSDFEMDDTARSTYESIYAFRPRLEDPRLEAYRGRRASTLLKVAICVAGLRSDNTVIDSDLRLAHELLNMVEPQMHKSLEYFGRNRIYQGRMLMLNYLKAAPGHSASKAELIAAASSELNAKESEEAITTMLASGELFGYGETLMLGEAKNDITIAQAKKKAGK